MLRDAVGDVRLLWDRVVLEETVKEGLRVREEVVEEDADSVGVELGAPVLDFWTEKVEMSVVVVVRVGRALAVGLREKVGLGEDVKEAPC